MATPRELSTAEIDEIIDKFAETARVAESSGFGGACRYTQRTVILLRSSFRPCPISGRTSGGGDPERRRRFLIEIVRRIRSAVAPGFAVSVKLNSADFQRGGFSEDESREVVRALTEESVDLIEISGGSYESPAMMGKAQKQSTRDREAYFLEYAETVRAIAGDIPLAVTGGFRSRSAMVEALASDACDVIGLGRPTITIPPDAATVLLESDRERLTVPTVEFGARKLLGEGCRHLDARRCTRPAVAYRSAAPDGRRKRAGSGSAVVEDPRNDGEAKRIRCASPPHQTSGLISSVHRC